MNMEHLKKQVKSIKAPDLIYAEVKRRHKIDLRILFSGFVFFTAVAALISGFVLFEQTDNNNMLAVLGYIAIAVCLTALAILFFIKYRYFKDINYELPMLEFLNQAEEKVNYRINGWNLQKWDTSKFLTAFFAIGVDVGASLILLGTNRNINAVILFNVYFIVLVLVSTLSEKKRLKSTHVPLLQTIMEMKSELIS
jgi:hypothetical protein